MGQTPNYRASSLLYAYKRLRITEVDMVNGVIHGIDNVKQPITISFQFFYSPFLAIPAVGEDWLVYKMDNNWVLHSRYENGSESTKITDLLPGDRRIEAQGGNLYVNAAKVIFNKDALAEQFTGSMFALPLELSAGSSSIDYTLISLSKEGDTFSKFNLIDRNNRELLEMNWGSGSADADVSLYRSSESTLTIDGNLNITGSLTFNKGTSFSNYIVSGYNPRRTLNGHRTTINEIADVLSTLLVDLGYAQPNPILSGGAAILAQGGSVVTSGGGTGGGTGGTGTAVGGTGGTGTGTVPTGGGTTPTGGGGTVVTGPQTVVLNSIVSVFTAGAPTITGTTVTPDPGGGGGGTTPGTVPPTNYSANVRPWDPRHIVYMPVPTNAIAHPDNAAIINVLNNGNSRVSNFKSFNFDMGSDSSPIYVGVSTDPLWTINGTFHVRAPSGIAAGSGSDFPLVILDSASAAYGGLPVEYRMWQATVNSGAKTINSNGLGIGVYANDGTIVPVAYRQDSGPGHRGPVTGHAEIYGNNTGSGESYTVGMIRPIDIQRGYIDHAIRVAIGWPRNRTMGSSSFIWPALTSEGGSNSGYCMTTSAGFPMGARLTMQRNVNWQTIADQAASRLSNAQNQLLARIFVRGVYEYGLMALDGTSGTFNVYFEGDNTAHWSTLVGPVNAFGSWNDVARACAAVLPWSQMMVTDLSNWSGYVS